MISILASIRWKSKGNAAMQTGILVDYDIKQLIRENFISFEKECDDKQLQPASLDLRLGYKAYRVRASFLPGLHHKVTQKLKTLQMHEIDLQQGAVFECGCVYIVPLLEHVLLPEHIHALANPKSSTGRLDIFTRLITDCGEEFDKVAQGYRGALYLEVCPRTFPIIVRTGSCLSQLRFFIGEAKLEKEEMQQLHQETPLVSIGSSAGARTNITAEGVALSIDLEKSVGQIIGYRAKKFSPPIDVDKVNFLSWEDFWHPIVATNNATLLLEPEEFYILASQEYVCVPPRYAAQMCPFDPLVGEFRVHYAGFFDPGFGWDHEKRCPARAVLEVRSREVPFILEHGQMIGRLLYQRLKGKPASLYGREKTSHYQSQGLRLSKHFKQV